MVCKKIFPGPFVASLIALSVAAAELHQWCTLHALMPDSICGSSKKEPFSSFWWAYSWTCLTKPSRVQC